MKKTLLVVLGLIGLMMVMAPASADALTTAQTTSALSPLPLASMIDDGWAILGALVIGIPGAAYFGRKLDNDDDNPADEEIMLHYRGQRGTVEHVPGVHGLCGHIIGANHLVLYEGKDFATLEHDFKDAVDEYLTKK